MKKLILALLFLLLSCPVFAETQLAWMNPYMLGSNISCSTTTDYVGTKTKQSAAPMSFSNDDTLYALPFSPVCASGCSSGNSVSAYLHHWGTGTDNAKVCIYLDDGDNIPDSGDSLVACSSTITSSTDNEFASAAITATLTCSNSYWLVAVSDSTTWTTYYNDIEGSHYYMSNTVTNAYSSPPSTLPNSWGYSDSTRFWGMYVTIGL